MNKLIITIIALFTFITNNASAQVLAENDRFIVEMGNDKYFEESRTRETLIVTAKNYESLNQEQLYKVAMKIAKNYHNQTNTDIVEVQVVALKDSLVLGYLAKAIYAADGTGFDGQQNWIWKVEAVKVLPTKQQVEMAKLWKVLRANHLNNGRLNEGNLKKEIAEKLGISHTEATDDWGNVNIGMYYDLPESIKL